MANFFQILEQKIDFSPVEKGVAERWFRQVERDNLFANAISSSGGGGGVSALQAGNVTIDLSEGITLRNPDTGDRTIYLDPDGDAWFGSNIDNVGDTTMSIFSNDQNYNAERMGKGDLLLGDNSEGKGNLFWDASTGELKIRSGQVDSVVIGAGGIVVDWATIGGWSIDATRIYNGDMEFNSATSKITAGTIELDGAGEQFKVGTGLVFDGASEVLTVGTGTSILIDGANELIKSSNYSQDSAGWQIDSAGQAEFASVRVRGSIQSSVFEYDSISAVGGGRFLVAKDASEISVAFTIGNSGSFWAWGRNRGSVAFAIADDVVVCKYWDGTQIVTFQATITTFGFDQDGMRLYDYSTSAGDVGEVIGVGATITNFGPSGDGVVDLQGGATPRLVVSTHAGTPLTALTDWAVLGNLNGKYGATGDDFGFGVGNYDSGNGNFFTYNADGAGTFFLQAGDGALRITDDGLRINEDASEGTSRIRWVFDDSGTERILGGTYGEYSVAGGGHVTQNVYGYASTGDPWAYAQVNIWAYTQDEGYNPYIIVGANDGGQIFMNAITDFQMWSGGAALLNTEGTITLRANDGANSSNIYIAPADTITIESDNVVHISNKGMYVGSVGAGAVADGSIQLTNDIFTEAWVDYASSSTIVGWASYTTKKIFYKRIGKTAIIDFDIDGTSGGANGAVISFTLPWSSQNDITVRVATGVAIDNGGSVVGMTMNSQNTNLIQVYPYNWGGNWTSSGRKWVVGQIIVELP